MIVRIRKRIVTKKLTKAERERKRETGKKGEQGLAASVGGQHGSSGELLRQQVGDEAPTVSLVTLQVRRKLGKSKEVRSEEKGDEGRHAQAIYSRRRRRKRKSTGRLRDTKVNGR